MLLMGKLKNLESTYPSATFPTTNATWTAMGVNPGLCGERLVTNRLSRGMERSKPYKKNRSLFLFVEWSEGT
jgi:hypothetical protein